MSVQPKKERERRPSMLGLQQQCLATTKVEGGVILTEIVIFEASACVISDKKISTVKHSKTQSLARRPPQTVQAWSKQTLVFLLELIVWTKTVAEACRGGFDFIGFCWPICDVFAFESHSGPAEDFLQNRHFDQNLPALFQGRALSNLYTSSFFFFVCSNLCTSILLICSCSKSSSTPAQNREVRRGECNILRCR